MKLWKVLMRKSTTKSNCKNCNRFDDSNLSINRYSSNRTQPDDYPFDNESNSSDFSQRIHEQFEKNIFLQQDLQSLTNYSITNTFDDSQVQIITKITNVMIDCSNGQTLGITLKGGAGSELSDGGSNAGGDGGISFDKTLTISHILENGPVYQNGLVQTGDRLLQVDDYPLHLSESLLESKRILRKKLENSPKFLMLTIEYNVNLLGRSIELASDSYFVEIEQNEPQFISLGLILSNNSQSGSDFMHSPPPSLYSDPKEQMAAGVFIEYILAASLSDRSGALKIGDRLLQVDDVDLLAVRLMPGQVVHLIDQNLQRNGSVTLRVLPRHLVTAAAAAAETISRRPALPFKQPQATAAHHKSHCFEQAETLTVELQYDRNFASDYGLRLVRTVQQPHHVLIESIARDSPAYLSGCLQPGDRIKAINSRGVAAVAAAANAADNNETVQTLFERIVLDEMDGGGSKTLLTLEIEFDIAANIIPASGIFTVRLPCDGIDLGFTLSSSSSQSSQSSSSSSSPSTSSSFHISAIRKGSIAYRSGILTIGDRLLAINDSLINQMNFEQLVNMLTTGAAAVAATGHDDASVSEASVVGFDCDGGNRGGSGFVSLRIQKFEQFSDYEYSVELRNTNGGPLGLTISGSEDRNEPLLLARLTRNGLAEKTGQLKVGDRIVSINGESVRDQPLSEAIRLLKQGASGTQPIRIQLLRRNQSAQQQQQQQQQVTQTVRSRTRTASRLFYSDEDDDDPDGNVADVDEMETASTVSGAPSSVYGSGGAACELHCVQLRKDALYDDYGFSVSDGLYRRGVYINRIRKGGPADLSSALRRFDRIVQVNHVRTKDFDCCLTVPLIAAAGEIINLVVLRPLATISTTTTASPAHTGTLQARSQTTSPTIESSTSTIAAAYSPTATAIATTATTTKRTNSSPLTFNL